MNGKKFHIVIFIIFIISIIGIAIVQYQYLRIGLNLAKVQFNQKIGLAVNEIKEVLGQSNELTFLVGKAITKDDTYFKLSIDSVYDASSYFLNDFLKEKLLQQGIKSEFTYTLYTKDTTEYLLSPKSYNNEDTLLKYQIVLDGYLPSLVKKRLILELQFKNLNKYFLSQLNGLTIPSLLFIVAILFVIIWVLKSFYWQKNLITITNEFINNLTHELKTPVFSIGIASKILLEKTENENKELVSLIRSQVDKLKNQIEKVLELASLEGKRNFIERKVIDFNPVIINLIKDFKKIATMENIQFLSEVKGEIYMLNCNSYHLENAINGLLENAKKYSNEKIEIALLVFQEEKRLIISVKDNGIGISDNDKKNIFDKYYRVSSGDVHNVKGYGLGLNYAKRIVKLHKGKITVKSTLGQGSEFIISLPLIKNEK
ncbi:MAG: HAMP domain-containing histidine kinase [Flavobacteriaceae bacterium]|nr:HAMP domain-containing histidine kinase [Flavobacteriaceae bacterium]